MDNIRIPIDLTKGQNITFKLEQDFEQLEILSLNMSAYDVYLQMTSDFGAVIGRVNVNGGFGVQNAKVSIFVPITADDELRSEIIQLYPFSSPAGKLTNGVRYNLLPRTKQSNYSHQPVGCFPDITDLTHYPTYLEVYEKYYKFTTTTNDSGDYMLFGVPLGAQYMHMDFDLFDTESFLATTDELVTKIKTSTTVSAQLSAELTEAINPNFELTDDGVYAVKIKSELDAMPNIFSENKLINVVPFWGDASIHEIGITRCDFEINYEYTPTAILFGSFLNMSSTASISISIDKNKYGVNRGGDNGKGLDISGQTGAKDLKVIVYKHLWNDKVERYGVYSAIPDSPGVFVLNLPMYNDYYITNEFGQYVPAPPDSKRGIPTTGYYVFEFFDDDESDIGNGRRSVIGNDGLNNIANLSAGIRVPANRNGKKSRGGWGTTETNDSTLFKYDIVKGSSRFYTIQTEFRPHVGGYDEGTQLFTGVDLKYTGNVIAYLPNITDSDYNIPIDGKHAPADPTLIGTLFSPRFTIQEERKNDLTLRSLLYAEGMTWTPWIPRDKTGNHPTHPRDWLYGVGVRHLEGVTRGEVFSELYGDENGDMGNYPIVKTWFFGDNPWDGENVPIANFYAQLLAQKPDANGRNISAIHNRYNLAVTGDYTAGLFVSSILNASRKILFETAIVDVTDDLADLIKDSVYTSYGKDENNQYNGKYYLFGRNVETENALAIIQKRYFNE